MWRGRSYQMPQAFAFCQFLLPLWSATAFLGVEGPRPCQAQAPSSPGSLQQALAGESRAASPASHPPFRSHQAFEALAQIFSQRKREGIGRAGHNLPVQFKVGETSLSLARLTQAVGAGRAEQGQAISRAHLQGQCQTLHAARQGPVDPRQAWISWAWTA